MSSKKFVLEIRGLHKTYRRRERSVCALKGVSLSLSAGEFLAVRGPSGCGKTTLLLTLGGLLRPDEGQILIESQDPYTLGPEDRARLRAEIIGFVFQQFHLVPYLNVRQNVLAASLGRPSADAGERADRLIERFGLTERVEHVPADLSTGECQRVALARAMLNRPKLLLADEPTGNLDDENARAVLEALAEFARDGGSVLLTTHDFAAARSAHRLREMKDGALLDS